jgi:hypothetical protein
MNDPIAAAATGRRDESLLDLTSFGYEYRADAPGAGNPSVTQWLTGGAGGTATGNTAASDTLAGIMWEEHRPIDVVEVEFDKAPDPARLLLEVTTNTPTHGQDNRPTWWTRHAEPFPGTGVPSADGRRIVYHTDPRAIARALEGYPEQFRFVPDPRGIVLVDTVRLRHTGGGDRPVVKALRAYGCARVSRLNVEIEWGLLPGDEARDFSGEISIYNGRMGEVTSLEGAIATTMSGPRAWTSKASADHRRGIAVELFYVKDDTQEVRFTPSPSLPVGNQGILRFHPNRTVVTVNGPSGSFSFAPKDLESRQPILVPGLGFSAALAGARTAARDTWRETMNRRQPTIRQRVRALPEQSFARALADHYTTRRPPLPLPPIEPPMAIDIPDEQAASAWRLAYWHVRRRCTPAEDGIPQIVIWPYKALLGQESWRIFLALDLLGEHQITRSGFQPWFQSQGTTVARGCFEGNEGALQCLGLGSQPCPGPRLHAVRHGGALLAHR